MRTTRKLPAAEVTKLKRTAEDDQNLERYLKVEVEDYISGLSQLYSNWQDYIRMYRGIPVEQFSRDPIPVRNIEVALGAVATDTLVAQITDMLNSAQPTVTIRGAVGYEKHGDALQKIANHLTVDNFTNYREAAKNYRLDVVQLGTGLLYTTWQEEKKMTGVEEIIDWGPRIHSVAPEEILIPPGAQPDIQAARLVGFSTVLSTGELLLRGEAEGWNTDLAAPTRHLNPVTRQRHQAAHVTDKNHAEIDSFEIYEIFLYYPYGNKGYDIDLYCVWDRTSARILYLDYNPFDARPFSVGRYQYQPHSFFGLGVMEMIAPMEREVTDWHNFRMANAKLVGSRAWGVKIGSPMSGFKLRIVPNKPLYFQNPDDLKEFRMADVYPSALQYEQASMQLADRRVGTMTDFAARPMPGHRTPGITAMSMLQQINKRFTTAFEEIRGGEADAIMQCVLRMQEQFKKGAEDRGRIAEFVNKIVGSEDAEKVFEVFRGSSQDLRDAILCEMTASSTSINREADKQSALQVINVLAGYYDKMMQLAMGAANPQTPPQAKQLMVKIATDASAAMDKFLKQFDQIRDTHLFLLSEDDFNALVQQGPAMGGGMAGGAPGGAGGMEGGGGSGGELGGGEGGAGGNQGAAFDGSEDVDQSGF